MKSKELSKEEIKFLNDNKHIFKDILPLQKKILEEKNKKITIVKNYKTIHPDDSETILKKEKEKKIKAILEKMSMDDINKYETLFENISL